MKTERLFETPLTEEQQANSILNQREFREGSTVLKSYPRRLVFELTNRCNFQCIMCGREAVNFRVNDLPVDVVTAFEPFYSKTEEVTLHGWGEGTLHPKLPRILEYLNGFKRLRKYFVTNGSTIPKIRDLVFEHHVDLMAVSLDGSTAATNDSIRKGGNFLREVDSVTALMEEKKRRGAAYPYVNFVFTAMKRNISELPGMVALAKRTGVPEVKVVYLTVFDASLAGESLLDMQDTVRDSFALASELAAAEGIKLKLPEIQGEGEAGGMPHKPCAFAWRDFYIGSDCFVRPCQSSSEKLLGLKDYGSPLEAWNSAEMIKMRATVNSEERMPSGCLNCYHSSCANWNLKSSFVQYGKTFAPEWMPVDTGEAVSEGLQAVVAEAKKT
ncbi:radical SAM protein [bacterium]|nr:radical SAM protein [bacterium]